MAGFNPQEDWSIFNEEEKQCDASNVMVMCELEISRVPEVDESIPKLKKKRDKKKGSIYNKYSRLYKRYKVLRPS